jgi:hypothetical protein
MDAKQAAIVAEYRRQREALLAEYPELAEDETALRDTLEGETQAPELVAEFIRAARQDEAMADALGEMMAENAERKKRLDARASRRRKAALALMQAMDVRKIEMPDFTASVRAGTPSLQIPDDVLVPDDFCKYERKPDRTAIRAAMKDGLRPNWATLSEAEQTLSARFK